MTMDEYERNILELIKYVSFIRDKKVKIHIFLSWLLSFYKDKLQFDEPENLKEAIRLSICMRKKRKVSFPKGFGWQEERKHGSKEESIQTTFHKKYILSISTRETISRWSENDRALGKEANTVEILTPTPRYFVI